MSWAAGCAIEAPLGPKYGRVPFPGEPIGGKATYRSAVPPKPQAAVQQWVPGPKNGSQGGLRVGRPIAAHSSPFIPPAMRPSLFPGGVGKGLLGVRASFTWPHGRFRALKWPWE